MCEGIMKKCGAEHISQLWTRESLDDVGKVAQLEEHHYHRH